ncbi:MAG: transglycosylase SLT domain-containing protein, partial [Candidatus Aenigmarchaeota archaeon]|nr:transglycosylase SLT domain-containing protein [Candidatus Aenigmarchaeota archaeon]
EEKALEKFKVIVDSYPMRDVEIDISKREKREPAAILKNLIDGDFIRQQDCRNSSGAPITLTGREASTAIPLPENLIVRNIFTLIISQPDNPKDIETDLLRLFNAYNEQRYAGQYSGRRAEPIVALIIDQIIRGGPEGSRVRPDGSYKGSTRLRQRGYYGYTMATVRQPEFKEFITAFEQVFEKGTYSFSAPKKWLVRNVNTSTPGSEDRAHKEPEKEGSAQGEKQFTFYKWEVIRPTLKRRPRNLKDSGGDVRQSIRKEGDKWVEEWPGTFSDDFNNITVDIDEPGIMLKAHYHSVDKHEHHGPEFFGSPYRGGRMPGAAGYKDSTIAAAGKAFKRGALKSAETYKGPGMKEESRKTFSENPITNAAANKGKRLLNQYIRAEYSRIFDPLRREFEGRRRRLQELAKEARRARGAMRKELRSAGIGWFRLARAGLGRNRDQDLMNIAQDMQAQTAQPPNMDAILTAYRVLEEYDREYRDFEEGFSKKLEAASSQLRQVARDRAVNISVMVSRRFKVPLNSPEQTAIQNELDMYAEDLAERFATRGRTMLFALTRGLESLSRGLQTTGAGWTNIFYNLWGLIIGPWTTHTIFVLIQFFFILQYVGYDPRLLWIMPLVSAVFTFLLSFENSRTPLDWLANLSTGAMMGYSAILFMTIIGAFFWFDGGLTWTYLIIWAALALFIGNFQIYQTGGNKSVMTLSIVILFFAYVALGPYSGYYQQAVDQVRPAAELAYNVVSNAVNDVYLLATNPTEWYSRQQRLNAVPEKPLSIAKGIEIIALDGLPQNVPAGLDFALASVIKNDGELEQAQHISVSFDCNAYCDKTFAKVAPSQAPPDSFLAILPPSMREYNKPTGGEFYLATRMSKGESDIFNIQPFIAKTLAQRRAETQFAKVNMTITYVYTASSSLLVTVIDQDILQQRFRQGEDVFKQVAATAKVTPARLSLNVGPQPLIFKTPNPAIQDLNKVLLLVSISSARDDSSILLTENTRIILKIPTILADTGIDCGPPDVSSVDSSFTIDPDNHIVTYTPKPLRDIIEIETYKTNSIYSFICKLPLAQMSGTRTSLITAQIGSQTPVKVQDPETGGEKNTYDINNGYFVKTVKEKGVIVTAPIGVLFEPYEQECRKAPNHDACLAVKDSSNPARTCYYEYYGKLPLINNALDKIADALPFSEDDSDLVVACHVCGSQQLCGKFLHPTTCTEASPQCGWNCKWNPDAVHPKTGQKNGACEDAAGTVPAQQPVQQIAQGIVIPKGVPCSQKSLCVGAIFTPYSPQTVVQTSGVRPGDAVFANAVGAVMGEESRCAHYYSTAEVKCGVSGEIGTMQILASTAAGHGFPNPADLCDPQLNVQAGATYLNYLANLYGGAVTADDQWHLAFAAYNIGETKITAAINTARTAGLAITWSNVKPIIISGDPIGTRGVDYSERTFTGFKFPTSTNNCNLKV